MYLLKCRVILSNQQEFCFHSENNYLLNEKKIDNVFTEINLQVKNRKENSLQISNLPLKSVM